MSLSGPSLGGAERQVIPGGVRSSRTAPAKLRKMLRAVLRRMDKDLRWWDQRRNYRPAWLHYMETGPYSTTWAANMEHDQARRVVRHKLKELGKPCQN